MFVYMSLMFVNALTIQKKSPSVVQYVKKQLQFGIKFV